MPSGCQYAAWRRLENHPKRMVLGLSPEPGQPGGLRAGAGATGAAGEVRLAFLVGRLRYDIPAPRRTALGGRRR
jgi:hypothetical protein